jgi:hypothetical protein
MRRTFRAPCVAHHNRWAFFNSLLTKTGSHWNQDRCTVLIRPYEQLFDFAIKDFYSSAQKECGARKLMQFLCLSLQKHGFNWFDEHINSLRQQAGGYPLSMKEIINAELHTRGR